ncbi:hypothetical protein V8C86DRAFT_921637 [Haematococcus lacustris]
MPMALQIITLHVLHGWHVLVCPTHHNILALAPTWVVAHWMSQSQDFRFCVWVPGFAWLVWCVASIVSCSWSLFQLVWHALVC